VRKVLSAVDSEQGYEGLRQEVIDGSVGLTYGLAILLRQGMASWLEALGAGTDPSPEPALEQSPVLLPGGAKDQVVRLLAEIVLDLYAPQGVLR
jgi:hypothetical protein